ncbi:hypothetical protein HN011_011216 [Eciton burchellii]|nr:hypothetical protein HN011_011216 [Eciton burchellii]
MSDQNFDELDWVKIRENSTYEPETILHKAKRKLRENPLVPIGCLATTVALTYGLYNFYKGNAVMQQHCMRARVGAQAFTILSIVAGLILLPQSK